MQLKRLLKLSGVFSLFLLSFYLVAFACGHGLLVSVYISDPARGGMEFYDSTNGHKGFVKYEDTDKFIAFTPSDAQALFDYCGILGKK